MGEKNLRRLVDLVETSWREEPDAWHALCRFLRGSVALRIGVLAAKLQPHLHQQLRTGPGLNAMRQQVIAGVLRMVEQAQADGALRADIGPVDVALLMTLNVYTPPGMHSEQAMERVVEIMLNGLRADAGSPLPGTRLGEDELSHYIAVRFPPDE